MYKSTYLQNRQRFTDLEKELIITRGDSKGILEHGHTAIFEMDQQGPTVEHI